MQWPVYIIDTFTTTAFRGNPTAVCLPPATLPPARMQSIASELNLPVTAFIYPVQQAGTYEIRYFTPVTEIPACGHATLASACAAQLAAYDRSVVHGNTFTFHTAANIAIRAAVQGDAIMMAYPRYAWNACDVKTETLASLGLVTYGSAAFSEELETLFIVISDAGMLRNLQPDFSLLVQSDAAIKEVVVTCRSDKQEYDYLLRSFCPWIGIDEDPVTGSVHSVLAGFWKEQLQKSELKAYQASQRGGELLIRYNSDRVEIGGHAVVILKGEMNV